MLRITILSILSAFVACGGGGTDAPAVEDPPARFDPPPEPAPQLPALDAEVIGMPGESPMLDSMD